VISTGFKILCSYLCKKYINCIHLFNIFPSFSHMWPPLCITCTSKHCLCLYWVHISDMRENMCPLLSWVWLTSLKMMFFISGLKWHARNNHSPFNTNSEC
jgi:hypothetical protein